jgi:hypothetical protein
MYTRKEIAVEVPRTLGTDQRYDAIMGVGMLWNMLHRDLAACPVAKGVFEDAGDGLFSCSFTVEEAKDFATAVHLTVLFEVALTLFASLHPEDTAEVLQAVVLHETRGDDRRHVDEVGLHAYANHNGQVQALWAQWSKGIKQHTR